MIDQTETLGNVAARHPGAGGVLLRHRLDFCCGGGRSFVEACRLAGLDPSAVAAEIDTLENPQASAGPEWSARPLPELIDHILERYHAPLGAELEALVRAARRVERVHGDKPACPHGLGDHLSAMAHELQTHMAKEERILFPAIVAGHRGQDVHMPVRVMMQEHDDHGHNLKQLRQLATDFHPPTGACATWRGLYSALAQLELELMQHIHLENNILFPRALEATADAG